jgi:hypothetical protein
MDEKVKTQQYRVLHWIALGLIILIILLPFLDDLVKPSSQYKNWSGDIIIGIPFFIIAILSWFIPIAGGVGAIAFALFWVVMGYLGSVFMEVDIGYLVFEGVTLTISGILSIVYYFLNSKTKHKTD